MFFLHEHDYGPALSLNKGCNFLPRYRDGMYRMRCDMLAHVNQERGKRLGQRVVRICLAYRHRTSHMCPHPRVPHHGPNQK